MYLGKLFKRKRLALVLVVIFFLSAVVLSQEEDLKVRVKARRANIREKPSLKSDIVAQVRRGRILQVDGKEGEWYRVRLPLKLEGYALPGYVHQSIVEVVGKKARESEGDVFQKTPSGIIHKFGAGLGFGFASLSDRDYSGGMKVGGNFYFKLTKRLFLELAVRTFKGNIESNPQGLSDGELSVIPIQLSIQGRFPLKYKFVPYVTGGISYYSNDFSLSGIWIPEYKERVDNALGFHFGSGIDYFLMDSMAVNADVRYCLVKARGGRYLIDTLEEGIEDISLNSFLFGIGLKYYF